VAAAAWLPSIADLWPTANVKGLVDSGFHILPGSTTFKYFYEQAPWGPGPPGSLGDDGSIATGIYKEQVYANLPKFDWRNLDAIPTELASYDGRVQIAYLSCLDDRIVYSDRVLLRSYAVNKGNDDIITKAKHHSDIWSFLTNLHKCAPNFTFSYVQDCTAHHQTRSGFGAPARAGYVSAKLFTERFLTGTRPIDVNHASMQNFWFEDHTATGVDAKCSAVRRRRGVSDTTTTTADTTGTVSDTTTTADSTADTTRGAEENVSRGRTVGGFGFRLLASMALAIAVITAPLSL